MANDTKLDCRVMWQAARISDPGAAVTCYGRHPEAADLAGQGTAGCFAKHLEPGD